MDPGGNELESSLPQSENPCLIVEDSQPDSVALEDDPESSYRALLSRRLSNLQPCPHSPVLELISSPTGSRCSQTDSQSERSQTNSVSGSAIPGTTDPSTAFQEESQVLNTCPLPNKKKCLSEDMDSGADSTTHCAQSEEGSSQLGFLELSQSQVLGGEASNEEEENLVVPPTDSERHRKLAEQNTDPCSSGCQGSKSRSEVSSSSSSAPLSQTDRELRAQALLHSQGLHSTGEQDRDRQEVPSSQEDLFDADKSGAGVDSTVSEPDIQGQPTLTPAHSLRLLHLSGQDTLVQQSLSQSSVGDFVAPTQDNQTPLIVPNSPTGADNEYGDEPMDTSLPPEDQSTEKEEEPMETDTLSKPHPSASTPVSQNSPGFVLERTLSLPSQPEFSHDVFVPTQSQEAGSSSSSGALQDPHRETGPGPSSLQNQGKPPPSVESAPFTLALQLTVNTETSSPPQQRRGEEEKEEEEEEKEEDSQATQIDGLDGPLCVDSSDSATPRSRSNGTPSQPKAAANPKTSAIPDSPKCGGGSHPPQKPDTVKPATAALNVHNVSGGTNGSQAGAAEDAASCSQPKHTKLTANSCAPGAPPNGTPGSLASQPLSQAVFSQAPSVELKVVDSTAPPRGTEAAKSPAADSQTGKTLKDDRGGVVMEEEEEEVVEEEEGGEGKGEENTVGPGGSSLGLALSQSQLLSPEPMEEGSEGIGEDVEVIVPEDSGRNSQVEKGASLQSKSVDSQVVGGNVSVSTNGHESQAQTKDIQPPDRLSQTAREAPEPEGLKDKSLSDSSGEIPFHFTLPKEGELIGPSVSATPPLISHLKQTPRHSTPIESTSFSQKSAMTADVSAETTMTDSDIVSGESREDGAEKADGKLSLRMKLVPPVEEGSSERFSLQRPALSDEEGAVVKVTPAAKAVTSPSVFSRVRQVHRQQEAEEEIHPTDTATPVRGELFSSTQRSSQTSSLGCNSLPNSQSDPSVRPGLDVPAPPSETQKEPPAPDPLPATVAMEMEVPGVPEPSTPNRTGASQKAVSQQTSFDNNTPLSSASKLRQRTISQQTSFDGSGFRSPTGRGEAETPSFRRAAGPTSRRHVRTIQEVRTTITRIITDVYYEDGKEVERKVTEENEEPVVDCQVLDSDVSPCRTGSSLTSGDLADISSQSSKASSLQHSSGGASSSSRLVRPAFVMPSSRGAKSTSPRRGGGQQQRGHGRGQRVGPAVTKGKDHGSPGSPRALGPLTPRGRARRGRPPSRSSLSRGSGGDGTMAVQNAHGPPQSSSEDEPYTRVRPLPRLPDSSADAELPGRSDSLVSSPEEEGGAGSSFVGLRVVAKWSSNGYFYSGRITKDAGEGRFRLRFDDGYECEVAGRDVLLCDPIPAETEVTALLEDEYFSVGVVKGHKTEGQELFYNVAREGQTEWYSRSSVILSLEQGNRLREQHSLGPYEPTTPLTKASDISLDNLVEGKRRRRGDQGTPDHRSSGSPCPAGPSGKRKLMGADAQRTPAKRGRRGGFRGGQRVGVCNTSGSGTDLPGQSCDVAETHGPLPQSTSLFMGFVFMLTASSESDRLTNKLASDDDEEEYVQTAPFNRGYTESQLQAGGGFILVDFNEEQCKAAYQSLLIADQHCRTRRYLLCVAGGVPCVSHIWVRDCCKENKLLNYRNYLLPAGVGPDDAIVEWHPRCSPFKALKFLLVFEEPVELWAQLLSMSGASSVKHYQADKDSSDISPNNFDVVVTDCACPPLVKKNVTSQKVPLVSPEWLIQSLICGECLDYDGKAQYHHDYSLS